MKLRISILTIIVLFIMTELSSQTLMLSVRKGRVIAEMYMYPEWKRTVTALDYLEYQNGDHVVSYRFEDKYCVEACIVMPQDEAVKFIQDKEDKGCWVKWGEGWTYNTNVFDTDVVVVPYMNEAYDFVTFCYKFRE